MYLEVSSHGLQERGVVDQDQVGRRDAVLKSTSQGAADVALCTTADPTDGGKYFDDCQATNAVEIVRNKTWARCCGPTLDVTEKLLAGLRILNVCICICVFLVSSGRAFVME
jgi:hypothetical protein